MWQFCVPLVVCVFAYWKIWRVILRQAKVNADRQPRAGVVAAEPPAAAGTRLGGAGIAGSADDEREEGMSSANKVEPTPRSSQHRQPPPPPATAGQAAFLSQAKLNVIKTMVYVVVCFVVCFMPQNLYLTYNNLKV